MTKFGTIFFQPRSLVRSSGDERGFTLIEVLSTVVLLSVVLTLGAGALRSYWMNQAIPRAQTEISSQLKQLQQRSVSESHPLLFGIRFRVGSSDWAVIKYDQRDSISTTDDVCIQEASHSMSGGVTVSSASFNVSPALDVSRCPGSTGSHFALFFAKGTATAGRVELLQETSGRAAAICISGLTSRVDERTLAQSC